MAPLTINRRGFVAGGVGAALALAPDATPQAAGPKRVRVGVNSRSPLQTRVVMEIADGATYHLERSGADG